jgi:hypothetical protein
MSKTLDTDDQLLKNMLHSIAQSIRFINFSTADTVKKNKQHKESLNKIIKDNVSRGT